MKHSFSRGRAWVIATSALVGLSAVLNAVNYLDLKAYLHTPEVFEDRQLRSLSPNPSIPTGAPYGSIWYIKYDGYLSFADLHDLMDIVKTRKIPGIDLSGQKDIFDQDLFDISEVPLRYLNFSGTRISDRGLLLLYPLKYDLEVLILNKEITDAGLLNLAPFVDLTELSLADTHITDKGMEVMKGFERLERLDLGGTLVTDQGLVALAALPLKQLRLGPRVTDAGLAALQKVSTLEQLDLAQTLVTETGLKVLIGKPLFHTLFAGPKMTDAGVAVVSAIPSLRRLDLSRASITDQGVKPLARLKGLEELALSQTSAGDEALKVLLSLRHLRFLEISDTHVSVNGLRQLIRMKSLQVLSFSAKTKVTLGDLKPLGKLKTLQVIIVNGVPLPYEAMAYIRGFGPKPKPQTSWEWIPDTQADSESESPLNDGVDVASLTGKDAAVNAEAYTGLKRIHVVESELDQVIPAPSMIGQDNQQDTEKNFMGEFTVGGDGSVQRKTKPPE